MTDFIPKQPIPNNGSMVSFEFCPEKFINGWPAMGAPHLINDVFAFHSPHRWYKGYMTPNKGAYSEDDTESVNGDIYKLKFAGFIPDHFHDMVTILQNMKRYRYIVKAKNSNGRYVVIGTHETPLRFAADLNTTTNFAGLKGYAFMFWCDATERSPFYQIQAGGI